MPSTHFATPPNPLQPTPQGSTDLPTLDSATSTLVQPAFPPLPNLSPILTPAMTAKFEDFVQHLWYSFSIHEMLNL